MNRALQAPEPATAPENDGLKNLIEYACDRDPRRFDSRGVLSLGGPHEATRGSLMLTFPMAEGPGGVNYVVEQRLGLKTWSAATTEVVGETTYLGLKRITLKVSTQNSSTGFYRLKAFRL